MVSMIASKDPEKSKSYKTFRYSKISKLRNHKSQYIYSVNCSKL